MNYVLFNADGSIKQTNFTESIQQNNNEVNQIFVSVAGLDNSTHSLDGIFTLPDGSISAESGEVANNVEYEGEGGPTANGYILTITINETKLAGVVFLTLLIKNTSTQKTLYTYRAVLTINKTAYVADLTFITLAQYEQLKSYFKTYVDNNLSEKRIIGTFNTSNFSKQGINNYYSKSDVPLNLNGGFITGSDLLIITWGNCFAICPIPQAGAGRVAAALWNSSGESQITRIRYELKSNNTLLDVSLAAGFTPPLNYTVYIQCIKL